MSIFIHFHAVIFSKVARWSQPNQRENRNCNANSHSGSLKVMHFGITEKLTTDCVSLCDNAGLISKVSENEASENSKSCHGVVVNLALM